MNDQRRYVRIAVNGPLRRAFIYHLPPGMIRPAPGQRLLVPFGRSRKLGFYLGEADRPTGFDTKEVIEVIDAESLFPAELFKLCVWMSDYYFANPADCLSAALPSVFKSQRRASYHWVDDPTIDIPSEAKKLIRPGKTLSQADERAIRDQNENLMGDLLRQSIIEQDYGTAKRQSASVLSGYLSSNPEQWAEFFKTRKINPQPFEGLRSRDDLIAEGWTDHFIRLAVTQQLLNPTFEEKTRGIMEFVDARPDVANLTLTDEQKAVVDSFIGGLDGGFSVSLLHGVTGSGKTLVYCHLAREVLNRGRSVLVLTPEISLSGTTLAYFRGFFGPIVTVLHSAMTERERLESWQGIRRGEFRVVVGPRSALFAPLKDPGLFVIDEEHDASYKQDDPAPRFHGRDAAIMRARINNLPVLLGSASPSVESYYSARSGRYRLLQLEQRPGNASLPTVHVVDMRTEQIRGDLLFFSFQIKKKIETCLKQGGQVILFLNRRGHSPQLKCSQCGHVPRCPSCRLSLTYHKVGRKLSCHYCGYLRLGYDSCDNCHAVQLLYLGAGTQKVEEEIPRLFSEARVARFDSDTASGRRNAHRILKSFAAGEQNLLLGTQMVTKGLDLPGVSLVGVLSADQGLDLPDFRAAEKTFARLLQVAGRSGRADRAGEVLIQTFYPDDPVIADAAGQNYHSFYAREIKFRKDGCYPPFCRLVNILFSGVDEQKVEQAASLIANGILQKAEERGLEMTLLGPAPCPLYVLRKQFRRHLMIKTRQTVKLTAMVSEWEAKEPHFGLSASIKVVVDVDPDDMM